MVKITATIVIDGEKYGVSRDLTDAEFDAPDERAQVGAQLLRALWAIRNGLRAREA